MTTSILSTQDQGVLSGRQSSAGARGHYVGQSIIYLIVCIALLEGYFKFAGVGGQEFLQPDLKMGCRHIPDKRVVWRLEGYSDDKLSSVGLRDNEHEVAKKAGVYRIALLGDSAVESLQVDLNQTFGKVLESLLNEKLNNKKPNLRYEVINFGCSSYSTGQELMQYEQEVDKYQPDAVVLLYNRGDSMENTCKSANRKHAEVRPYFYVSASGQLQQDDSVLLANFEKLKANPIREFLRKNSAVFGILCQADLSLTLNEPRYRKVKSWIESITNFPKKLMASRQNAVPVKLLYPDQDDMLVTKSLISKLTDEIAAKHRTFVLATFPNIWADATLLAQAKELKDLAREKEFKYLDLSQSFLAQADPHSNFIQYHFSKMGHAVVAQELVGLLSNSR